MIPEQVDSSRGGNRLLVALAAYTPIAVAVLVLFDGLPAVVRLPLGIPVLLFAPGYAVVTALLPGSRAGEFSDVEEPLSSKHPEPGLSVVERLTLSVVASVAIVPAVAFALSPAVGVSTAPTLVGVSLLTVVASFLAVSRRSAAEVDATSDRRTASDVLGGVAPDALTVVTGVLVVALLAGTLVAGLSGGSPAPETEFYVAGTDGGDAGTVDLRIDHEAGDQREFTLVVAKSEGDAWQEISRKTVVVGPNELGRTSVDTAGLDLGSDSDLRFLLYEGTATDSSAPHRTLQLSFSEREG